MINSAHMDTGEKNSRITGQSAKYEGTDSMNYVKVTSFNTNNFQYKKSLKGHWHV